MMKSIYPKLWCVLAAGAIVFFNGCTRQEAETAPTATPPKPKEAAAQLQQAFTGASAEVKTTAEAASQAIRTANYEQAIQSIQVIKAQKNLTMEQGMAVYHTERALEASLIAGIGAGDPNAKRAYELLKKSRRN